MLGWQENVARLESSTQQGLPLTTLLLEVHPREEHTNFFENRATDYSKGAMTGSWDDAFD